MPDAPVLRTVPDISAEGARELVDTVVAASAANGRAVSVAVVDGAGVLVAFVRMTGAPRFSAELAAAKARTAAAFGSPTSTLEGLFRDRPAFTSGFVLQGNWYLGRGGVPLRVAGGVAGGVGVSGDSAEHEEAAAHEAVAAFVARHGLA